MESNCVTLETAKRLKRAGFPQYHAELLWRLHLPNYEHELVSRIGQEDTNHRFSGNRPEYVRYREENEFFDAPCAQEIADQLFRERVTKLKWQLNGGGDYFYISCDELGGYGMGIHADTMAEALASLWLASENNNAK